MRLHLLVTGQHSPLSTALCFNYFSLFSLPPFPSLPTALFSCDYSWEGSQRGWVGEGIWRGGGVIGQQVKPSGKGHFYMAEFIDLLTFNSSDIRILKIHCSELHICILMFFWSLTHSHTITPTHISLVERLEKTWACGLFQRLFVLLFLVLQQH